MNISLFSTRPWMSKVRQSIHPQRSHRPQWDGKVGNSFPMQQFGRAQHRARDRFDEYVERSKHSQLEAPTGHKYQWRNIGQRHFAFCNTRVRNHQRGLVMLLRFTTPLETRRDITNTDTIVTRHEKQIL